MSPSFRFFPELFEHRTRTIEILQERGFMWLSHYSAVDPLHDEYGIEVCGIRDREDAGEIQKILRQVFPAWRSDGLDHKDYGREPGWIARIYRDGPRRGESWDIA